MERKIIRGLSNACLNSIHGTVEDVGQSAYKFTEDFGQVKAGNWRTYMIDEAFFRKGQVLVVMGKDTYDVYEDLFEYIDAKTGCIFEAV